jgi:hypothetical protein
LRTVKLTFDKERVFLAKIEIISHRKHGKGEKKEDDYLWMSNNVIINF